ncbi:hypothetical protein E8E12_007437 [Didymella heteroderae]|uniref:RING-type domain-containing protein n=1 Tax=Didymella heteroderae TaxID=1769908 RepID=A0A9P4WPF7_9PLEO|nr:hypothetical protein E8E12_007437 [Didymella heteroderae]
MSRVSTSTLDHQWDAFEVLNIQCDRRCVGRAHSMGRKCRNVVNWKDTDTFYGLLDDLSSQALDATRLRPRLRELASVGLCKQVHRRAQIDDMIDAWTNKIRAAARRVELEELEMETYYSRTDTRSSTASFRAPATRRTTSSTSTNTVESSSTVQDEIDSTLRCLEAAREQERILTRRLASLQASNVPRTQRAIQDRTTSAPSPPDTSSVASSRTLRSPTSTTSRRSTSSPPSSDSSPPPDPHRQSRASPSSPAPAPSTRSPRPSSPTPSQSTPIPTTVASPPSPTDQTALQPSLTLLRHDFLATHISLDAVPASHLSRVSPSSFAPRTEDLHDTLASPTTSATSTEDASQRPPPRCALTHVRRRAVADDCPICYEAMRGDEGLVWCKAGCGQSVHGECMDAWKASLGGREVRCTMCRTPWTEECGC